MVLRKKASACYIEILLLDGMSHHHLFMFEVSIYFQCSNKLFMLYSVQGKGIEVHEKTLPDGKAKQAFFFDPDGKLFVAYLVFTVWFLPSLTC